MKNKYQFNRKYFYSFLILMGISVSTLFGQEKRSGEKNDRKQDQPAQQERTRDETPRVMDRGNDRTIEINRNNQTRTNDRTLRVEGDRNIERDNSIRIDRNARSNRNADRIKNDRNDNNERTINANRNVGNNNRDFRNHNNSDRGNNNNYNERNDNRNRNNFATINRPGYRPVYGYDRNPVYNHYNPSWRYSYLPCRNTYYYSLPSSFINISFGGGRYHYWDGVFYRPFNNLFTVIAPPIGIYINSLPLGHRRIMVRNYPYYYYNGTYYDQRGSNYFVVSPPLGAVVESLPEGYETVVINGETFYTIDGAQYKPMVQQNGEIWYEVIKAN